MNTTFVMTGGGTGGHVYPALAVAEILRARGRRVLFIGTRDGMEARLVPEHGYEMEFISVGQLNRVGLRKQIQTAMQLPAGIFAAHGLLRKFQPQAVFSMGGYVAGPVMAAAVLARTPLVVMEPNAIPGLANRRVGRRVYRALLGFESARWWFPPERAEVTGLPVRSEFFELRPKAESKFTVLITGGSRGARTLNRAARESWRLFRESGAPVRIVHQAGTLEYEAIAAEFRNAGIDGEVMPFIHNMAEAFAQADLVIARAGAGSVNEIAAGGMASVLVPLPTAADDHQRKNAEALADAGAAQMVLDADFDGRELFDRVEALRGAPEQIATMRERVKQFAKPGAAERAADVLEEAAGKSAFVH